MALGQMFNTTLGVGAQTTPGGQHKRLSITIQGTPGTNAVNYNLANVVAGEDLITRSFFQSLLDRAKEENTRRGGNTAKGSLSTTNITAADFNNIRSLFAIADSRTNQVYNDWSGADANLPNGPTVNSPTITTFPTTATPTGVPAAVTTDPATQIRATILNSLINALNSAGQVCTCNCNYCTCNCNYCTCNCNYACTCNCNYS